MKILSAFSPKPKVYTNPGSQFYNEARVVFEPDGNMKLQVLKERDRFVEIQSYKDSTDVNQLIRRYENGDQTALLRSNSGVFCDVASMPKNIHEAHKLYSDVDKLYSSMGDDIKAVYKDPTAFAEAFSSADNFKQLIKTVSKRKQTVKAAEASKEVTNA